MKLLYLVLSFLLYPFSLLAHDTATICGSNLQYLYIGAGGAVVGMHFVCSPPTERVDGTPLSSTEITEYKWYVDYLWDPEGPQFYQSTPDCNLTFWWPTGEPDQKVFGIRVTAVANGLESEMSNQKIYAFTPQ